MVSVAASNEGKERFVEGGVRSVASGIGPLIKAGAVRCIRTDAWEMVVASVCRSLVGCSISVSAKASAKGSASRGRF